jgi:signal transduction histidine kinase
MDPDGAQDTGEADLRAPGKDGASSALAQILAVEASPPGLRRLLGALADGVTSADALLLVAAEPRPEVIEAVGVEASTPDRVPALAEAALAAAAPRLASSPGEPFPAGTRVALALPLPYGAGVLLVGSRTADRFADDDVVVLRVAAERAGLALLAARLERERDEARSLAERSAEELRARRAAVDHILGIVGHDLRNPLGAIHMSAALLQKKGGLEGWQARTVERVRSSAGRMGRIIADLLTYTRTRLGNGVPVSRRPASLETICRRVVDELLAANPDRVIELSAEGDPGGEWDPDRLEQVASNLVSNAVDHGDPQQPVRVAIAGEPDAVVLEVANRGDGFPPEVLEHLFEPFARPPEEKSRKGSGLGLGLYIARQIVQAHGGEIGVRADGETVIRVRLPRRPPQA